MLKDRRTLFKTKGWSFLLIQSTKSLKTACSSWYTGNLHNWNNVSNAYFTYRTYNRIQKCLSDCTKTIVCWRWREDWWIIFTLPSTYIWVLFTIVSFYHIIRWSIPNMPWLYTVEQCKITDRSDACELWYLFQFLDMNFQEWTLNKTNRFLVSPCSVQL